ncbi:alginate lyase family protein [Verrucomicrobium sp. GAS474]|uniref:alginate lyase family protein n=1 Tax=Verrucomicrobium sp. GAS474 TaxID=1882831 RepID=UPI0013901077|nr:alginate lyase family protein [Verrucomicrobium sp. GAS474]
MLSLLPVEAEPASSPGTLAELEAAEPGLIATVLGEVDLSRPGLEAVKEHRLHGETVAAGEALLAYYAGAGVKRFPWLGAERFQAETEGQREEAEAALHGTFTLQGVTGTQQRTASGGIDWNHYGPRKDPEWAWMLNRQAWFLDYLASWSITHDGRYVRAFDAQVTDWIVAHPSAPSGNSHDSPAWRSLEIGRRLLETWPAAFYGFAGSADFRPATRMRMLASIALQADSCLLHPTPRGNHLNTECLGLAAAAAYWPEFRDAPAWLDASVARLRREYANRVYPDGAQMELSDHYQIDVATAYQKVATFLTLAGHPAATEFEDDAEKLWSYIRLTMKPDGNGSLNNDGDAESNWSQIGTLKEWTAARGVEVAGGIGKVARDPQGLESVYFPWSGLAIVRGSASRGREADWFFFDTGPLGTAHEHQDTLHLSVYSGGRDLLVDAGRYTYKPGRWRRYFTGQRGHNVVLFDADAGGSAEIEDPPRRARQAAATTYLHRPDYDFVSGMATLRLNAGSATGYGLPDRARHRRSLLYVRDAYAVVLDEVFMDGAHRITVPWHFDPKCTRVSVNGNEIETANVADRDRDLGAGNLRIVPIPLPGVIAWRPPRIVMGESKPLVQGWWSPSYNVKLPAPVALYESASPDVATPAAPKCFAWLLVPGEGTPPDYRVVKAEKKEGKWLLTVRRPDGGEDNLALRPGGGTPSVSLAP